MNFAEMNKTALRSACKEARISYGGMSNDQMRAALEAHHAPAVQDAPVQDTPEIDLAALGKWGKMVDDTAACPHCGINHIENGYTTPDDYAANSERTLHEEGAQHAEFQCMACNGEWGPVRPPYSATPPVKGKGLKIEKDRIERNGIKQPSLGGACRSVWDACTEMQALDPATPLKVAKVKEHAATMQWNVNNAVIEFYRWKKWSAPTEAELAAVAPATE